jgi:hypothetical protein
VDFAGAIAPGQRDDLVALGAPQEYSNSGSASEHNPASE